MTQPLYYPWYVITLGRQLEQGDILQAVPHFVIPPGPLAEGSEIEVPVERIDAIVMSQSCDLVAGKIDDVALCPVYSKTILAERLLKFRDADLWEKLRRGEIYRYHLLNRFDGSEHKLDFSVVDLTKVFTLPFDLLADHAARTATRLRLQPPYREQLSQSFARFYMRVGLPIDIPPFK